MDAMKKRALWSAILVAACWVTGARADRLFSPRGYCHETGGAVLETGDRNHYICCYAARRLCLAVSMNSRTSVKVHFSDEVRAEAPQENREQVSPESVCERAGGMHRIAFHRTN